MRGHTLAVAVRSPEYTGRTNPAWIRNTIATPYLDCSATISDDGWVALAVVNVNESTDYTVSLEGVAKGKGGEKVQVYTVGGGSVDDVNTADMEKVGVQESTWDGDGGNEFTFKKASLTVLRWKV